MAVRQTRQAKEAKKLPFRARYSEKIELVEVEKLLAHPDNWRIHPEEQRRILAGAIRQLGFADPLKVSRKSMTIIDGHARLLHAKAQAWDVVPVMFLEDLTDEEERMLLGTLDALVPLAEIDYDAILANLRHIDVKATDADLAQLFDWTEMEANDQVETEERMKAEGNSNFGSIKKTFRERKVVIKAIYALEDAHTLERALAATGNRNRAEALVILAKSFLDMREKSGDLQQGDEQGLDVLLFGEDAA